MPHGLLQYLWQVKAFKKLHPRMASQNHCEELAIEGLLTGRQNLMVLKAIREIYAALLSNFGPRSCEKRIRIDDQVVLLTGAGSGIGRQIALELVDTGCKLVLWDIDQKANEETKKLCEEMGAQAYAYCVDVSSRHQIYATAARVASEVGDVNIVVNNAGMLRQPGEFLAKSDDIIEKTVQVNMLAHVWMAKAFLPRMLERGAGHIVCVCSLSGIVGAKELVDYSASKFGAFGFQEALENEMYAHGKRHIHFTTVCPSYIRTSLIADVPLSASTEFLSPQDVAQEIVDAILTRKRILLLPKKAYVLYAIKGLLPRRTFQRLLLWIQD